MNQTILVRSPNWLGDAVMALPFLDSLRRNAPDSEIVCLCREPFAPLFSDVESVGRVIVLDDAYGRRGWKSVLHNASRLRREKADLGFCLPPSFGSAFMFWWGQVPRRFGHAADGRRLLLTGSVPYGTNGHRPHRTEHFLELLDLVWPRAVKEHTAVIHPGEKGRAVASEIWNRNGLANRKPVLAIAPGSAKPASIWPYDRYAALAARWTDSGRGSVVIVGTAGEFPLGEKIRLAAGSDRIVNLAGSGDISAVAAILQNADQFVGNDSGASHLAAAVGTPTIVMSGAGDPTEVRPSSPHARTLRKGLACSPCYKNVCPRTDEPLECLTLISVDDVWDMLEPRH